MSIIRLTKAFSSVQHARFFLLLAAGLTAAMVSRAQLPPVQVPGVPLPEVGRVLPSATEALGGTLRDLTQARSLRADRLLRQHRAELDRDPRGELVVRAEVVAIDLSAAALERALKARFRELRSEELTDLGVKITVLQTPEGMSASRGLKTLRKLDPEGTYDFNHVYLDSGETADITRPHGTAVASILLSRRTVTELFSADVYCGAPAGGAVDTVAAAFGWMAREKIAVINVSLVGPRNVLLERVVKTLVDRGHLIVAAVGNDGPAAPPLYPASYEGVVGVTGVDGRHRVLIEAGRGPQVDFAALGANVSAATGSADELAPMRGTSFAAPLVAALLASMTTPDPGERERLLAKLAAEAQDLGKPGRDDVYGAGELGAYK
jgi:hypothetical protein